VAVAGDTAVVGANGTTNSAGAAYIYVKGSSGWPTTPTATLTDPAAKGGDLFGSSVALSGNTAVVGANGTANSAGAAYIYVRGSSGWPNKPTATLSDPATTSGDSFGSTVALSEHTAVVGANGTGSGVGAAYIYVKGSSGWPTTPTVSLGDPGGGAELDHFGSAVAVSGSTALVGADGDDYGHAYIYVKGSSGWPTTPTVPLADPPEILGDNFGSAVAVSRSTAVIGATGGDVASAYVYVKGSSGWPTSPSATPADPGDPSRDNFGASVAVVSGGKSVVSAPSANSGAGAAYLFLN
jgi:hypothetical protein